MKFISKFMKVAIVAALVIGVSSCSDDDDNVIDQPATMNIVELAAANTDLTSLVAALTAADTQDGVDLLGTLSGTTKYTVLAPTNAAFEKFLGDNGFAELGDVPLPILTQILTNHVIAGEVKQADLESNGGAGYTNTLSESGPNGEALSIYYNAASGVSFNGVSNVATADVAATNGVVHVVDAVIGLPNITTFATADPSFSKLVGALTDADLVGTVMGLEQATVFAPVDAAFDALSEVPTGDALVAVLQHHVVNGANAVSGGLTDGMMVTPLAGGDITINLPGNDSNPAKLTDGAGNADIDVIAVDVQATNGVIHAIESVLLPAM